MPPQLQQPPLPHEGPEFDDPRAILVAKTDSSRSAFWERHLGHSTKSLGSATNSSNLASHSVQRYSNIGMVLFPSQSSAPAAPASSPSPVVIYGLHQICHVEPITPKRYDTANPASPPTIVNAAKRARRLRLGRELAGVGWRTVRPPAALSS